MILGQFYLEFTVSTSVDTCGNKNAIKNQTSRKLNRGSSLYLLTLLCQIVEYNNYASVKPVKPVQLSQTVTLVL